MIEGLNKDRHGEDQAIRYLEGQGFAYSEAGWALPAEGFLVSEIEKRFVDLLVTYGYAGLAPLAD